MKRSRISLPVIVAVALIGVISTLALRWKPQLGLDLRGGASVVLQPKRKVKTEALNQAIAILRSRIDEASIESD